MGYIPQQTQEFGINSIGCANNKTVQRIKDVLLNFYIPKRPMLKEPTDMKDWNAFSISVLTFDERFIWSADSILPQNRSFVAES